MSTSAITSNTVNSVVNQTAKSDTLSMENFMHLLTVQLANQNPLEPMNDRDFFAQMAQLGQVQGMDDLKKSAQVTQAQSLMGKTVTAFRPNSDGSMGTDTVTGVVSQLSIKNGNYTLGIQDASGGGLVEVDVAAVQAVTPQGDLTSLQTLIGKDVTGIANVTVNGKATPTFVEGTVSRIFTDNNLNFARVHLANGTDVDMNVGDIRSIAPAK